MNDKSEAAEGPEPQLPESEAPEHHEHAPAKQTSGGSGAFLATVLVLLILGGGFFYLWQQQSTVKADMNALEGSIDKLLEVIEKRHQEQLTTIQTHQHSAIGQNSEQLSRLHSQIRELRMRVGQDRFGWMVAEVDYLLRIADNRLSLEHDRETAIAALRTARSRLKAQDNDIFADVIQKIDENIDTINAVQEPNRNLLAERIAELLDTVEQLPLSTRATPSPEADGAPSDTAGDDSWDSFWQKIRRDLRVLVTIRREGEAERPVLAPQPRYFLRQNLQLKLESARLALLSGNSQAWRGTLNEAKGWLSRYFDVDNEQVSSMIATLDQLAAIALNPPLPKLDATRTLLQQTVQQATTEQDADSTLTTPVDAEAGGTAEAVPDTSAKEEAGETTDTKVKKDEANAEPAPKKPPAKDDAAAPSPPVDDMPPIPEGDQL